MDRRSNTASCDLLSTHSFRKTWIADLGKQIDSRIAIGLLAAMVNQTSHLVSQGRPSWTAGARMSGEPAA